MGYRWKRARQTLKPFRNQQLFESKSKELESLINLHKEGFIDLYYGDESHFGLTPNVPYAWQHKNNQVLIPCRKSSSLTVFGLDNAPIHRSKLFKSKIEQWEKEDLYIFFLPPYSPELNKIEILWRFIKYRWLPFDAFLNFQNLKERLNDIIQKVGSKYVINFY